MKCKEHPRYKGSRRPTSGCEVCWAFYLGMCEGCYLSGCEVLAEEILDKLSTKLNVGCEGD